MADDKKRPKLQRGYLFTIDDYTESDEITIQALISSKICTYGIYIDDIRQDTHVKYLSGCVEFRDTKSLNAARSLLASCVVEPRTTPSSETYEYYLKNCRYKCGIVPKRQGQRTDIQEVRDSIACSSSIAPCTQQAKKLHEKLSQDPKFEARRTGAPYVVWIFGASGTGKTANALQWSTNPYVVEKPINAWYGYNNHSDVLIDNITASWYTYEELLRLLGHYSYSVETSNGPKQLLATQITITCLHSPYGLYKDIVEDRRLDQLMKRVDIMIKIDDNSSPRIQEYCWAHESRTIMREAEYKERVKKGEIEEFKKLK
jgi:hypothetical protein